jgi:hypothetical protein
LNRFPMIQKGDVICTYKQTSLFHSSTSIWDGTKSIYMGDWSTIKPIISDQFSPYYWVDICKWFLFSEQIKNRLRNKLYPGAHQIIFRIGKHKWTLSSNEETLKFARFVHFQFKVVDWEKRIIETWTVY